MSRPPAVPSQPPGAAPGPDRDRPPRRALAGADAGRTAAAEDGTLRVTVRALRRQARPLRRLAAWSLAEAMPALLTGYVTARAVDDGFLAGRPLVGLGWLGALAVAIGVGAFGTGRTYACLGDVVEPFRDELAHRVVTGALRRGTVAGARPDTAAVARLTHQVEIVRDTFGGLVMVVRGFLFASAAALIGLLSLAPVVAALVAAPLVVGLALFVALLPAMIARQRDYVYADERLGEHSGAAFSGHRDVVACGAQDTVAARVGRYVDDQATAERALARMAALRSLSLAIGGWLPLVILLAAAPWLVRRGMTPGGVLGALVYVCTGLQPALHTLVRGVAGGGLRFAVTLTRILSASRTDADPAAGPPSPGRQRARPDGEHDGQPDGEGTSDRPPDRDPAAVTGPAPDPAEPAGVRRGEVRLRGLTFRYGPRSRPILDGLDLDLADGEHLAVVGPSGVGKSTLAALIAGMLPPDAGSVRVAGRPVTGEDPVMLARLRVLVPQEAYVFTGSVAENLRYLAPAAGDPQLLAAIRVLGAETVIDRLGGLDATLDPSALSAGERQLVAAVRAYLSPARVAILDEATCHLDPTAEARVERAFAARAGTLLVIAHRISSALRAGRVLILDGGPPMLGTHQELVDLSPTYRSLVGHWGTDDHPVTTGT